MGFILYVHIGIWRGLAQFSISKFNFMKKNITLDTKGTIQSIPAV